MIQRTCSFADTTRLDKLDQRRLLMKVSVFPPATDAFAARPIDER